MNFLFVLYIGFDQHGPSVHLLKEMIRQCLESGHHVRMIVTNHGGSDPDIPVELQHYKNLHCDVIYDKSLKKSALVKRYFQDFRYAFLCKKIYKRYKDTDAVFLQSNPSPLIALKMLKRTLKAPVLFNVQNIFPIDAGVLHKLPTHGIKGIPYSVFRKMQQSAYKKSDLIVTISEDMKQTLLNEKVPESKIRVIYNWSYSDEAAEIADEDNLFLRDHPELMDKFRVVFAGNLGAMVNPVLFAEAAEKMKAYSDIIFIIIGDGNNMNLLKSMAKEMNLTNMVFFPYQPKEYARHNYAMANVNINALPKGIITTCMPSKTSTILNAARPMVVAVEKESSYAKILSEVDKCVVVDWNDSKGFSDAIIHFYEENIVSGSSNAREVFKPLCSVDNAKKYVECLEELKNEAL